MTTTTGLPPELEAYLAAVRATLADLAPEERDDLLGEVQAALLEAAGEGDGPIAARLGPPEEFAAELRASAGLDPAPPPGPAQDGRRDWRADLRRVADALRRAGRELAPIWWVGRAYILVAGLAVAGTFEWSFRQPALPRISNTATTIVVLALAALLSVGVGLLVRRAGPAVRAVSAAFDVLILLLAIPVISHIVDAQPYQLPPAIIEVPAAPPEGLSFYGAPVTNVYAYDRDGNPLYDVRLYDQNGAPLDVYEAAKDPLRRAVFDERGVLLLNAFPIRFYDPGTETVSDPAAAPVVDTTPIQTPSLLEGGTTSTVP
jgi:HAAS domain-containing protein